MYPMEVDKFIEKNDRSLWRTYVSRWYDEVEILFDNRKRFPLPPRSPSITCEHCKVLYFLEEERSAFECPYCGKAGGENG